MLALLTRGETLASVAPRLDHWFGPVPADRFPKGSIPLYGKSVNGRRSGGFELRYLGSVPLSGIGWLSTLMFRTFPYLSATRHREREVEIGKGVPNT